jgi:hypothetical protein
MVSSKPITMHGHYDLPYEKMRSSPFVKQDTLTSMFAGTVNYRASLPRTVFVLKTAKPSEPPQLTADNIIDVIVDVNNNTNCTISSVAVSLKKITRSTVVFKDAFTDKQAVPYGIL